MACVFLGLYGESRYCSHHMLTLSLTGQFYIESSSLFIYLKRQGDRRQRDKKYFHHYSFISVCVTIFRDKRLRFPFTVLVASSCPIFLKYVMSGKCRMAYNKAPTKQKLRKWGRFSRKGDKIKFVDVRFKR